MSYGIFFNSGVKIDELSENSTFLFLTNTAIWMLTLIFFKNGNDSIDYDIWFLNEKWKLKYL